MCSFQRNGRDSINEDLIGRVFGKLTVVNRVGNRSTWHCVCECGNEVDVSEYNLLHGKYKSCGCITKERLASKGFTNTKLHGVWAGMKSRCSYNKHIDYEWYQAKGITVCEEWKNSFKTFHDWAMTHGYKEGLSLERIDNNKGYCPENCRWATPKEQANNRSTNINITYNGETKTLKQWAESLGINYHCLYARVRTKGIPFEEAIAY